MARTRRQIRQAPSRLILDSGAVIALARGDARARAYLARAIALDATVEVPVVVVAETIRGGPRDAAVNRVLKAIGAVAAAREVHGRTAGALLADARSTATVDALVVAHAVAAGGAHVLTSDHDDLARLAVRHAEVLIHGL
jgi:predicted nucleic acid-binding protein